MSWVRLVKSKIVKKDHKYQVQSEKGKNLGTYDTKAEAEKRLKQVEYFKHKSAEDLFNTDYKIECFPYYCEYKKTPLRNYGERFEFGFENLDFKVDKDKKKNILINVPRSQDQKEESNNALSKALTKLKEEYGNLSKLEYVLFHLSKADPDSLDLENRKINTNNECINFYFYNGSLYNEHEFKGKDKNKKKDGILGKIMGLNQQKWHAENENYKKG